METISQVLTECLKAALITALPIILALIGKLIQSGMDYLEALTTTTWLRRLEEEAETVILALWELTAKGIKEDAADGKITAEEARSRLSRVKMDAVELLKKWLLTIPAKFQPTLSSKLSEAIEGQLGRLKLGGVIPVNPPQTPEKTGEPSK